MSNEVDELKVQAYLRAFARLVETQPGTPDFDTEQTVVDTLWEALNVVEKAVAHEQAEPYRTRLARGRQS